MPRWAFMWAMAFAIYGSCKWLTYQVVRSRLHVNACSRSVGYLLAWPGMDAAAFLSSRGVVPQPAAAEWIAAALKTLFGATLTWVIARTALPEHPLLAGWVGMVGLVFVLHFGTFHLLSLVWRARGIDARPIMDRPARAVSLAEFWGRRWNRAFHELVSQFTFRPLRRSLGASSATFIVFVISGLIHELVITVPAQGGYGWPTAYFLVQALGMHVERSRWGRSWGLGRGWRGWLFTAVIAAAPAYWLFPPPFMRNVILPMLDAIGAT
jgi:hypothetical protein